jgi:hypothetical protein
MKPSLSTFWLALSLAVSCTAVAQEPADPGWPRVFKQGGNQITVYEPQVDYWHGFTNLHYRAAIAVKVGTWSKEKVGVAEVDAVTVTDPAARLVAILPTTRDLRFPNVSAWEAASLRDVVDQMQPPGQELTISLDRLLAYIDTNVQTVQHAVDVNLQPPRIFYSRKPAILVMFMGEPELKPVETNRTDLMFAINSNWDVFYDVLTQRYYLLNGTSWLTTDDVANGPWVPAGQLPAGLYTLPDTENWADVHKQIPGKSVKEAPVVFATAEPAELILTKGAPSFSPIPGTRLMRVANTESILFYHTGEGQYYFLAAGRWFRSRFLDGPWSAASADLPADFASIPDDNVSAFVKSSVPGTREAEDAVLLASVPTTTTVVVTNVIVQTFYEGPPQFTVIQGTTVQYAVNSPNQVFLVNGGYYWCYQGAWLAGATPNGPWVFCSSVPAAIYTIPPSNPNYNVTYVVVQSWTPTTVVYSQTAGYSGEYVAATGVLMFGMGILVGAAIANNNDHYHHYHYPPPCHYSYGCGAVYRYGYGGYAAAAHVSYGPYGGAGRTAAYNPYTGTYSRGAYAYGPAGSASIRQAYNPYTGGYAQRANVNTAYGSAGRFYAEQGGNQVWGGHQSGPGGTVGWAQNNQGGKIVAGEGWRGNQGVVAKDKHGNIYAGKDGNVYKRESGGGWQVNSGDGWNTATPPARPTPTSASQTGRAGASATSQPARAGTQPTYGSRSSSPSASTTGTRSRPTVSADTYQGLNRDAQSRSWGDRQAGQVSSAGRQRQGGGGRRR